MGVKPQKNGAIKSSGRRYVKPFFKIT